MERCKRPGCNGEIQDGFCLDCGLAPVGHAHVAASVASPMSAPRSQSVQSGSLPVSASSSIMTGSRSRSTSRSTGRALGAGFISLPPLPSDDPLKRILADPVVPEKKRFCGSCNKKVTRESGFCPFCGKPYSFEATLKAGELVAGQYEVKGPIAFGGFGWIYLAQDTRLKKRWVVLKGLLNSKDAATAEAALQEREFLSAVKHPNIVAIYNFVTHGTSGYIVMEYIGGLSLGEMRKDRGALPPAEALAYIHRILAAFGYLEEQGLVYCDFKPPNAMVEDDVKLIDMGGVRRVVDVDGNVYGTTGFFAPEIGEGKSPSFVSDLYTVARTLAILIIDFDLQGQHQYSLPGPADEPLFAQHDSLYRFLLRGTHRDPEQRFQSAGEMSEQLLGVLRDVVAGDKPPRAVVSSYFVADTMDPDAEDNAAQRTGVALLPALKVDAEDPASNSILAFPANDPHKRAQRFEALLKTMPASMELKLRLADACIAAGLALSGPNALVSFERAAMQLESAAKQDPFDWRVWWYQGKMYLAKEEASFAYTDFDKVYGELPGELGAKLGCAIAAEKAGHLSIAERQCELISRCDPNYATAGFGLAHCRIAASDRDGAAAALSRIPPNSNCYLAAQMEMARVLIEVGKNPPLTHDLERASETLKAVAVDGRALHDLRAKLLLKAVAQIEAGAITAGKGKLLDVEIRRRDLRLAAENELRECARCTKEIDDKIDYVDRANTERPRTFI